MTTKQAKTAFLKQIKPFVKRYETERKRKITENRHGSARQTTKFKAHIVQGNKWPEFVGIYSDKHRGEMSMVVPILFDLDAEFAPGVAISDAQFQRLLSLCE
jgi:hypothetical protein